MAQSIKLGNNTYLDESDVMLDSSSSYRKTIAQARSQTSFSLTYTFTPTTKYEQCYYNPLTKEVHLNVILFSNSQGIPGAGNAIATVPAEYSPSAQAEGYAVVTTTDNTSANVERAFVRTNGALACGNFLVGTNMRVFALNMIYHL